MLLEQFGESVTYHFQDGSESVVRLALVERDVPTGLEVVGGAVVPVTVIRFHNDEDLGILASAVNAGGDSVTYEVRRLSGDTKRRYVHRLEDSEGAVTSISLR